MPLEKSKAPGAEAEGVRIHIHVNIHESSGFQAFREAGWVNDYHSVEQVEQTKTSARKAVRAGEDSARTQNPGYFRQ